MTEETEDGGSAFPQAPGLPMSGGSTRHGEPGMSLRDYFASQSVWLASIHFKERPTVEQIAERAYAMADALLKARK